MAVICKWCKADVSKNIGSPEGDCYCYCNGHKHLEGYDREAGARARMASIGNAMSMTAEGPSLAWLREEYKKTQTKINERENE